MKVHRSISTQVWLFILISSLVFLVLCSQLGGRLGLFIGLMAALTFHVLVFVWGEGLLLRNFQLTPIEGRDPWGLNARLEKWSQELKIAKPQLYILKSDLPTAFSFEVPWRRPLVTLSETLLRNFSREEIEMVLAHQLCQLRHRQTLRFGVMSLVGNILAQFAVRLDKIWIPNFVFGRKQNFFLTLFSPILYLLIRFSFSSMDQYASDRNAAQLLGSRERLGRLLWRLESWSLTYPMEVPPATSQLFIVNPERRLQKNQLLQFHPTTRSRLEKLVGSYPL
ncbi:MAG: M48 family metalloprotease [Bdellovibrionales bacterium]